MVNPDGAEYDISGGTASRTGGATVSRSRAAIAIGVDLNRNWGYMWGCCGGSSGTPGTTTYRGPVGLVRAGGPRAARLRAQPAHRWPPADNARPFRGTRSTSRSCGRTATRGPTCRATMTSGRPRRVRRAGHEHGQPQRLHRAAAQRPVPDRRRLRADWLYGDQRIFAFTIEMYPTDKSHVGGFYPPDSVIDRETTRNDDAVLYFLEQADCPYSVVPARRRPTADRCTTTSRSVAAGRSTPTGTDTATGRRDSSEAIPAKTANSAGVKQLKWGFSGQTALVTGARRWRVTANDVDGGTTSAQSPPMRLGGAGSRGWTLDFRYSFAHNAKPRPPPTTCACSSTAGGVPRGGQRTATRNAAWQSDRVDLDAFAGQHGAA